MIRAAFILLFALSALATPAFALSCPGGSKAGYTCVSGTWVQNCADGSIAGPSGCTVDEITVTAAKGPAFADVVNNIASFVDKAIIPLLYIFAFLFFLIGIVQYFFTGGEENRQKGRGFALWGLVGMVVIFGLWGVVKLLLSLIPGA